VSVPPAKRLIVGNWKMNLGEDEARALVRALATTLPFDRTDAGVAPAFPCLRAALDAARGTPLTVGAQNVHADDRGAFTGEVSAAMLAGMGVRFVIVGHSERRTLFGETDALIARKVAAARRHGLVPILCVGETEAEREAEITDEVVARQIHVAVDTHTATAVEQLVVAYEPVWAIGTGRTPSPRDVTAAHRAIRAALHARIGTVAAGIRILYGGSATPANAPALLHAPEVGGALVGGASLDAATFAAVARLAG